MAPPAPADVASAERSRRGPQADVFSRWASFVDGFFSGVFYNVGAVVGGWPATTAFASVVFMLVCCAGYSQLESETDPDELWTPQGTRTAKDAKAYGEYFRKKSRFASMLLESTTGQGALGKTFLVDALSLHLRVDAIGSGGDTLRDVCILRPRNWHPCQIASIFDVWEFDMGRLQADPDPVATLTAQKTKADLETFFGSPVFAQDGTLVSAKAMVVTYILRNPERGTKEGDRLEEWEGAFLNDLLQCDEPSCEGGDCPCGFTSGSFAVYAQATRSWGDAMAKVIQSDFVLVVGAFAIMIVYLSLNLGSIGHKFKSRTLLALGCTLSIVAAGVAGYGLASLFPIFYSPVNTILPFVLIGIGVDDAFVITSALDRTDKDLPTPERISIALSEAGVSIMITSLTDFLAFAISISTAFPALSSFCLYAAVCILLVFFFQVTLFTPLLALDTQRVSAGIVDCCVCLPESGWPCCPTVPPREADRIVKAGGKDPNCLCPSTCCSTTHPSGLVGYVLERYIGPFAVQPIVSIPVVMALLALSGLCAWRASELRVESPERKFIPDGTYFLTTLEKQDELFAKNGGARVDIVSREGDYPGSQRALANVGPRLSKLDFVEPLGEETFRSWADAFRNTTGSVADLDGFIADGPTYYGALEAWVKYVPGARYGPDLIWKSQDPLEGLAASRISAQLKSVKVKDGDQLVVDADLAVETMKAIRAECDGWHDMPGGAPLVYSAAFRTWETLDIIKRELFMSVGLCLLAVLVITMLFVAHPLTSTIIFVGVAMTVVDVLGFMNLIGLAIDSVTVIQLVIAVGLSVDYSVHIGHSFMLQAGSRRDRAVKAIGGVGAAVINGGLSTLLGVLLLAFSSSYVFRVLFTLFLLTVIFGLVHGLFFVPMVLSLIGPSPYAGRLPTGRGAGPEEQADRQGMETE